MPSSWPDIPGVTAAAGQPRLPSRPDVVVRALAAVLSEDVTAAELVARVTGETGEDGRRIEGIAQWLPQSRVARWAADGRLELDPSTDLPDLAMRYAAWVEAQRFPKDQAGRVEEYARAVVEEALATGPVVGDRPRRPLAAADRAEAEATAGESLVPAELTDRLRRIAAALDAAFLERRTHTRAALLALLAGRHVLLLGPPGTAKSMLARALCACFASPGEADGRPATYFEYLLSRFTTPDELFGPVSIPGLKEEDYRRLTTGYLPQAHVAFLDEVFKANSAILNSLLTVINERVFHHGRHRDQVPLLGLIGASNELPDPDGGLDALYDRFLVRLTVPPIADPGAFVAVATGSVRAFALAHGDRITIEDLDVLRAAAAQVEVPAEVRDALVELWRAAARADWGVSDRRWRQAVHMLTIAAAADGRRSLTPLDLLLLEPVLAPEPERLPAVREAILEQLGTGAVPTHDLRAQWLLLRTDRVAPAPGLPLQAPPPADARWSERVARRAASADRFLVHHGDAIRRLGDDRTRLEAQSERHLWLPALPVQVLAAHIEASRDLARILQTAEAYRKSLSGPGGVARALLDGLPERSRRVYGHDIACVLQVKDAGVETGLTLAGERVLLEVAAAGRKPGPPSSQPDAVVVAVGADQLLDWIEGRVETRALLTGTPAWAGRNAETALDSARRLLGGQVVPNPPELPAV